MTTDNDLLARLDNADIGLCDEAAAALRARDTELVDRSVAYEKRLLQLLQCEFKRDAEAKRAERAEAEVATARTVTRYVLELDDKLLTDAERAWLASIFATPTPEEPS